MSLFGIAINVLKGREPLPDFTSKVSALLKLTVSTAETVVANFVAQFASDFGAQMLNGAETLAPKVLSGELTIQAAGTQLLATATTDAVTDAEKDGTVALNALRVQITAQTSPASTTPVVAPATAS